LDGLSKLLKLKSTNAEDVLAGVKAVIDKRENLLKEIEKLKNEK
jgi:hypothetical protein